MVDKRVTLRDVAAAAGVSRALRGSCSATLRQSHLRTDAAAGPADRQELGYVPH